MRAAETARHANRDRIEEARRGEMGGTTAEAAERVLELRRRAERARPHHSGPPERVRAYSRMLGEELGLTDMELDQLQWPDCCTTSAVDDPGCDP
jgi:hypothetical protein